MKKNPHDALKIILAGFAVAFFIEFFGAFVSELWGDYFYSWLIDRYSLLVIPTYLVTMFVAYVILFFAIYSIYHLLNHFLENMRIAKNNFVHKENFFHTIGFLGFVMIITSFPLTLIFDFSPMNKGLIFSLPLLGSWFLLEYVEYSQHKRSLLLDLVELRTGKLLAVILTSLIISLLIEGINLLSTGWVYKNLLFPEIRLFGIQIIVLLGWIPLVTIYLSFYRAIIKENDHVF